MIGNLLVWLVIVLGVCWLLVKFVRGSGRDKRDTKERDSHGPFRK